METTPQKRTRHGQAERHPCKLPASKVTQPRWHIREHKVTEQGTTRLKRRTEHNPTLIDIKKCLCNSHKTRTSKVSSIAISSLCRKTIRDFGCMIVSSPGFSRVYKFSTMNKCFALLHYWIPLRKWRIKSTIDSEHLLSIHFVQRHCKIDTTLLSFETVRN